MTIPKNTRRAKEVIAHARNIRCYSLSNHFCGEPLTDDPVIYGPPVGENDPGPFHVGYRPLIHVTQQEFLSQELHDTRSTKLSTNNAGYILRVHSNLWYEFQSIPRAQALGEQPLGETR